MGYTVLEPIGFGTYGTVYKGREDESGRVVALKAVDLEKLPEDIEELQREVSMMKQLNLPYAVEYLSSYVEDTTLWIVMEYMDGGSLDEVLRAARGVHEDVCATVLFDILMGLIYLHRDGKIHRDLKCGNVLISRDGKVKLSDFGVAGQLTQTKQARNTLVGSPYWTAPEVIAENSYNAKADIWSFGITAIELATGKPPHSAMHPMEALLQIPKLPPPKLNGNFSEDFKDLVELCCKLDPSKRPDAKLLVTHLFFQKRITDEAVRRQVFTEMMGAGSDETPDVKTGAPVRSKGQPDVQSAVQKWANDVDDGSSLAESHEILDSADQDVGAHISLDGLLEGGTNLSEEELKIVARSLLLQLVTLHAAGNLVRTVSPSTVELYCGGGRKIARFATQQKQTKTVDSLLYTAPEAIVGDQYSAASDVWSLGTLIFKAVTGADPFPKEKNPILVMTRISKGEPPLLGEDFSQELRHFTGACLQRKPESRPRAQELLESSFMKLDAASGSTLLIYEALEARIRRRVDAPQSLDDEEFMGFDDLRGDSDYLKFLSTLNLRSEGELDWDYLDEELPDVGEYLSSETFGNLIRRYEDLMQDKTCPEKVKANEEQTPKLTFGGSFSELAEAVGKEKTMWWSFHPVTKTTMFIQRYCPYAGKISGEKRKRRKCEQQRLLTSSSSILYIFESIQTFL
eukprot:CAMPEP_0198734828 /NCGR_PEP_ID=MMETSP1475-20131203/55367_1 /TAXON_ID= ORGANISM="Unidentified sp., Strain CCMP1999" /NCGR_SAMPLE_ID=MMETSP1475 /ASSEMBLY_ACC=CAM_ASM_001111 /LENGTH=684 /DNA_ID=CAMNT_0044498377 /DNA_START=123 /DNA_END=2178 /DNA_ORIENTATION=-